MPLKVLMICDSQFPGDIRIEKEIFALKDLTIEMHILTYEYSNSISHWKYDSKVHFTKNTKGKIKRGLIELLSFFLGYDTFLLSKAKELHHHHQFDVIHCHDLPLMSTAQKLLKTDNDTKLIFDIHENYPEGVKIWYQWRKSAIIRIKNQIFNSAQFWNRRMKLALKHADFSIVVCKEMSSVLNSKYSFEKDKIWTVPNTEKKAFLADNSRKSFTDSNSTTLLYIGGIGPHRGLDCAIKAIKIINKNENKVKLKIIGGGHKDNIEHLKKIAVRHNIETNIEFVSRIPKKQVFAEMENADINIIPHASNGHTESTVPHKLYQSMMAKKPLIVSDCQSLITATHQGKYAFLFQKDSPESLANVIGKIIENEVDITTKVNDAFHFATNEGSWEATSHELVELYTKLITEKNSTP